MPDEKKNATLPRILVVDDELAIQRFLKTALDTGEFSLHQAENGHGALAAAAALRPDIILLDLGLPDIDGVEVIRRIREWSQVPIIVLSVREREDDKVKALNAGADDYLTKPFGVGELLARIRVALRRSLQQARSRSIGSRNSRWTWRGGGWLRMVKNCSSHPTEYELLRLLVVHAGKVLTHCQILKQIWGIAYMEQPHVLRVNISNLRHKIEKDPSRPRFILTEPGVGYRLRTE